MFTMVQLNVYEPLGWMLKLAIVKAVGLDAWWVRLVSVVVRFAAGFVLTKVSAAVLDIDYLMSDLQGPGVKRMETPSCFEVPNAQLSSDSSNLLAFEDVGDELLLRDAEELLAAFTKKKLPLSGTERRERYPNRQKSERERLKQEVVTLTKRLEAHMKQQGSN
ncbi:Tetratricopeptide-like helical [Phytophthora cinnamomi]|uniref:Tetratricopeptide-like helical n=1 Tax=Phytophthora cinnamomi TaxID=4785 RepID=UPI00355A7CFF|nr:Tetratricopeptide-like helical [Phytophthora cinnamomi]